MTQIIGFAGDQQIRFALKNESVQDKRLRSVALGSSWLLGLGEHLVGTESLSIHGKAEQPSIRDTVARLTGWQFVVAGKILWGKGSS